ncbi:hypothetical protein NH340_JMT08359 [Sarcoptes scabiei]|nr:hypothetical protein NH340_JMT08359 [Sarcoptes scabiei]
MILLMLVMVLLIPTIDSAYHLVKYERRKSNQFHRIESNLKSSKNDRNDENRTKRFDHSNSFIHLNDYLRQLKANISTSSISSSSTPSPPPPSSSSSSLSSSSMFLGKFFKPSVNDSIDEMTTIKTFENFESNKNYLTEFGGKNRSIIESKQKIALIKELSSFLSTLLKRANQTTTPITTTNVSSIATITQRDKLHWYDSSKQSNQLDRSRSLNVPILENDKKIVNKNDSLIFDPQSITDNHRNVTDFLFVVANKTNPNLIANRGSFGFRKPIKTFH